MNLKYAQFFLLFIATLSWAATGNAATAFVTNQGEHTVSVIDTTSNQAIKTIKVGQAPVGVAVSGDRVYVSNVDGQSISIIDGKSMKLIQTIAFPGSPVGMAVSPDGKTLYVANWTDDSIFLFNTKSR